MDAVLEKKVALKFMHKVNDVLQSKEDTNLLDNLSAVETANLKYCPLASVDVERSFSIFKNMFTDGCLSFTEQNLKHSLIVNCFHSQKG